MTSQAVGRWQGHAWGKLPGQQTEYNTLVTLAAEKTVTCAREGAVR